MNNSGAAAVASDKGLATESVHRAKSKRGKKGKKCSRGGSRQIREEEAAPEGICCDTAVPEHIDSLALSQLRVNINVLARANCLGISSPAVKNVLHLKIFFPF